MRIEPVATSFSHRSCFSLIRFGSFQLLSCLAFSVAFTRSLGILTLGVRPLLPWMVDSSDGFATGWMFQIVVLTKSYYCQQMIMKGLPREPLSYEIILTDYTFALWKTKITLICSLSQLVLFAIVSDLHNLLYHFWYGWYSKCTQESLLNDHTFFESPWLCRIYFSVVRVFIIV